MNELLEIETRQRNFVNGAFLCLCVWIRLKVKCGPGLLEPEPFGHPICNSPSKLGLFGIVSKFIFFENKNKNKNSILQLLYFKFKYVFGIIFVSYILKLKIIICI